MISWLSDSFFVFLTIALAVQGTLSLFRIQNYRLRAFFRMTPILALLFTPLFQLFQIGHFLNPLSCDGWPQKLMAYFFPKVQETLSHSKEELIHSLTLEPFASILSALLWIFTAITAAMFLFKLFRISLELLQLKRLIREARAYPRNIQNVWLAALMKKQGVRILVSESIQTPMAAFSKTILIPKVSLDALSIEELESVLAHEWAHLHSKDPWIKLFNHLTQSLFWWVPMKRWVKQIEEDQEIACDQAPLEFGLSQKGIASALIKIAKSSCNFSMTVSKFKGASQFLRFRLEMILEGSFSQKNKFWQGAASFVAGPLILVSCTM